MSFDISILNCTFTITVKEADVRYIKCNAPSNYTHTVQGGLGAQSEHDDQMPGYFLVSRERVNECIEFRCRAHVPGLRAPLVDRATRVTDRGVQAM